MNTTEMQEIESAQTISDVSQGDATDAQDALEVSETETSVSQNDAYTTVPYDDTTLMEKLDMTNNALTVITLLILAIWVESRLRNAVWRYFGHGKSD